MCGGNVNRSSTVIDNETGLVSEDRTAGPVADNMVVSAGLVTAIIRAMRGDVEGTEQARLLRLYQWMSQEKGTHRVSSTAAESVAAAAIGVDIGLIQDRWFAVKVIDARVDDVRALVLVTEGSGTFEGVMNNISIDAVLMDVRDASALMNRADPILVG